MCKSIAFRKNYKRIPRSKGIDTGINVQFAVKALKTEIKNNLKHGNLTLRVEFWLKRHVLMDAYRTISLIATLNQCQTTG